MVVVLKRFGIAYFPIPKVANTSVQIGLREICDAESEFLNTGNKRMSSKVRAAAEGCFKIAVIREPLERMLSAYGNRVIHHRDIARSGLSTGLVRLAGQTEMPGIDAFFQNLSTYMRLNDRIRRHLMLQRRYLGDDLSYFDAVYRIDQLAALAADLMERTGREVVFGRHQTGGPKFTAADLAPETLRQVMKYLAPDYALLSGFYPAPAPVALRPA